MDLLQISRHLLALSQSGLHFTRDEFDRERYREIAALAAELAGLQSASVEQALSAWFIEDGYATPKVEVRGAVFRNDEVLLVREMLDGLWSLPGGWADINDTPAQAIEKEIEQETGFTARAVIDPVGASVAADEADSLSTRLGVSLDRQTSSQDRSSHVYGIINVIHEWMPDTSVRVSGTQIVNRERTWWGELGVGGSYRWNGRVAFYAEGSAQTALSKFGDEYSLQGVVGLRAAF